MAYSWSGDDSYGDLDVGDIGDDYGYTTDLDDLNVDYLSGDYGGGFDTEGFEDLDPPNEYEGQDFGGATTAYDDFDINKDFVAEIPNPANPGQTGYGWKYYENGTAISPDGKYYKDGQLVYDPETNAGMLSKLGKAGLDTLKKAYTDDKGNVNWKNVVATGAGMLSAAKSMGWLGGNSNKPQPKGYQGKIPTYQAIRSPVAGAFAPTKAGEANRQYFSDMVYATPDKAAAAQAATQKQAEGLATLNPTPPTEGLATLNPTPPTVPMATGGLANLKRGTYLRGGTDGMADKLRTSIDGGQPAALSHGEFVVPADVVSHLGNGNSDAGAKRLYAMMDKVRQARTGSKKQGKQIDPNKYMPA
jgi:hypothetical protein